MHQVSYERLYTIYMYIYIYRYVVNTEMYIYEEQRKEMKETGSGCGQRK
jgi:hypothetical protein